MPSRNRALCSVNRDGISDPKGDQLTYEWNWGDGTAVSTGAAPTAHTYATAGTKSIVLTVKDGWNKVGTATRSVTVG